MTAFKIDVVDGVVVPVGSLPERNGRYVLVREKELTVEAIGKSIAPYLWGYDDKLPAPVKGRESCLERAERVLRGLGVEDHDEQKEAARGVADLQCGGEATEMPARDYIVADDDPEAPDIEACPF